MVAAIAILFFVATFLAVGIVLLITTFVQDRVASVRQPETEPGSLFDGNQETDAPILLRQAQINTASPMELLLKRLNLMEQLRESLEQARLKWTVGRVAATMLLSGSLGAAIFIQASWAPYGSTLAGFAAGTALPLFYISKRRNELVRQMESQFPDALESLARALRAGHPLQSSIDILAVETPAPLGIEFRRMSEERRLGMSWTLSLENFTQRVPIPDVRLFAAAAVLNSRSGGKLTEVMENLAESVRETIALRGEIQAISSHGRLTGTILTILPFGIAGMLWTTSPGYLDVLFQHSAGPYLISGAVVLVFAGHMAIRQIVKVKI